MGASLADVRPIRPLSGSPWTRGLPVSSPSIKYLVSNVCCRVSLVGVDPTPASSLAGSRRAIAVGDLDRRF